ncbi:AGE family epimerase/isomerase [Solimonas terrae]|uniref:AGE family epimerase/isomerase n=1 Tax=Solimonas terrae TaxID=1396819 RepID=A0A6M2BUR0_9GAMM|nr:AGE family epimerase/isomerase [Solimonas terrae]NGY05853.1 AGE family epimerase/isomerase [Solimonas terrae]
MNGQSTPTGVESSAAPQRSPAFLRHYLGQLISFYHPRCLDPRGGYFQFFRRDGSVFEPQMRHLVSSARIAVNYAFAYRQSGSPEHRAAIAHGIDYLRAAHRNARTGGYAWLLRDGEVVDATNHCYGLAFVMLAYAKAAQSGFHEARTYVDETWEILEARFWEPRHGLYADEASADWTLSPYRGQNANMHLCEAFIAAFEATGVSRFLDRAALLADHMVNRQAALCGGQVWEHYDTDWQVDWLYNKGDRSNIFRPWGLQPGHQIEWAKLLLLLERHDPRPWRANRAGELFRTAVELAWDRRNEGLIYGYDENGGAYDRDKYSWVQAEAMAAAALLAQRSRETYYVDWYDRIAAYSWRVFVDPQYGCWHRIRTPDNAPCDEEGCFSGLTDYHTMSACTDIIAALAPV